MNVIYNLKGVKKGYKQYMKLTMLIDDSEH